MALQDSVFLFSREANLNTGTVFSRSDMKG